MDDSEIKYFIEAALLAAGRPLSIDQMLALFDEGSVPDRGQIRAAVGALQEDYANRGLTIAEVASGFRVQIRRSMADRLQKLWEDRPPRYSRALFETLALIAYRQPLTRGEIEEVRGVSVTPNIIRTLLERDWIRVVGHRDVPGRPAMFGTTRNFLDYFGLKKLDDLPPLADISDWESLRVQLDLPEVGDDYTEEAEMAEVMELRPERALADDSMEEPFEDEDDEFLDDDFETVDPDEVNAAVALTLAEYSSAPDDEQEGTAESGDAQHEQDVEEGAASDTGAESVDKEPDEQGAAANSPNTDEKSV